MIPVAIIIFLAIGLHEFAHCKFADMAGDPTPRIFGRVTLNLTKHFELMGTIMIFLTSVTGFGIGWGKPAPMDPNKMRNPRWDFFAAVLAGPLSNVVQAVIWALLGRVLLASGVIYRDSLIRYNVGMSEGVFPPDWLLAGLIFYGVFINLSLAMFNMIPLGMLDGHWLLGLLMPDRPRDRWFWWNRKYGTILLIAIVIIGQVAISQGHPEFSLLSWFRLPVLEFGADYLLKPFFNYE